MLPSENIKRTLITSTVIMNDSSTACALTAVYNVNFTMVTIFHCKTETTNEGKIKHYHRLSLTPTPLHRCSQGNLVNSLQNAGFQISNPPPRFHYPVKANPKGTAHTFKGTAAYLQAPRQAAKQAPKQAASQAPDQDAHKAEHEIKILKTLTKLHIPLLNSQSTSSMPASPLVCTRQVSFFQNMITLFQCKIECDQHVHTTTTRPLTNGKVPNQKKLNNLKEKKRQSLKYYGYKIVSPILIDTESALRKRASDCILSQGLTENNGVSSCKKTKLASETTPFYQSPTRPIPSPVSLPRQLQFLLQPQSIPLAAPIPQPLPRTSSVLFQLLQKPDKSTEGDNDVN